MQPKHMRIHLPGGMNMPPLGVHQYLALIIVAIALWALGSVWMGFQVTSQWVGSWQQHMVLHVYVPQEKTDAVETMPEALKRVPGVLSVEHISHDQSAQWMQQWLGTSIEDVEKMAEMLPETWVVALKEGKEGRFVAVDVREVATRAGGSINEDEVRLLGMRNMLAKAEYLIWFVSVLMGLAMALIISNTLRMILLARVEEIHLMRVMGAREWFVRMPFVLEGLALGAAAGLLSWLLLWPWIWGTSAWLQNSIMSLNPWVLALPLLLGGALLGGIGALIATTRVVSLESLD